MSASDWSNLDELNERAEDDMTTTKDALPELPEWSKRDDLGGLVPSEIRSELRAYALAALASKQAPSEPFWHAVVSNKSPVINKAIKREDVAQEYADQCHEQGYRDAEVVPLYLASRPAEAQAKSEPAALTDAQLDALLDELDDIALNWGDDLPGLALNSRGREPSRNAIRAAIAATQGGGSKS